MARKVDPKDLNLPWDSYRWNRAILGSFKKGIAAHQAGEPVQSCPYGDLRKPDGRLSWSRSFIGAWRDGWIWASKGKAYPLAADQPNDTQRIATPTHQTAATD